MNDVTRSDPSLWQAVVATTQHALTSGHLQPLETRVVTLLDQDVEFRVRVITGLAAKPRAAQTGADGRNPFLPYDPQLYVGDVTTTHVGLLNKFNVVDHHLLLVTRDFQPQETRLDQNDFDALARGLQAYESLGFYNSCPLAGASQPHRHLQLIPLPMQNCLPSVPIETLLLDSAPAAANRLTRSPALPFAHHWVRLDREASMADFSQQLTDAYEQWIRVQGWNEVNQRTPYNFLVTRDWMMFVPRRQECCLDDMSLNALAFAGSLFAKSDTQLEQLRRAGPMRALVACAGQLT